MQNTISIKKYKIYNLQREYNNLSKLIFSLQNHIIQHYNNTLITTYDKNVYISKIYEIVKELNSYYNEYIVNECDIDDIIY